MYIHGAYFKNVIQVYSINAFTEFNREIKLEIHLHPKESFRKLHIIW